MAKKASAAATKKPRVFTISFASVYPLYLEKAAKKGRTQEEVDATREWRRLDPPYRSALAALGPDHGPRSC